jgi:hypothetical protein
VLTLKKGFGNYRPQAEPFIPSLKRIKRTDVRCPYHAGIQDAPAMDDQPRSTLTFLSILPQYGQIEAADDFDMLRANLFERLAV